MNINRNRGPIFDVEAEIKADVFTDIFDSMTKNMKENEKIFFIFSHREMKIWLSENSKTTQLQLNINKKAFKEYACNFPLNRTIFRKYELKKFLWFSTFFEMCKGFLKLTITEERIELSDSNGTRKSIFPVVGQEITEEEQEDLEKIKILSQMQEKDICKLKFSKSKIIQQVIHSGNAIKPAKLYLSYLSNQKRLRFDFEAIESSYLKVHVDEVKSVGNPISKVPIPFRKLKLATSLMESEKPFIMSLSRSGLMIDYDEENIRKYSISLMAEYDD